jgi:GT2 family glycosyltransferase
VTFWAHFLRLLPRRPKAALAALYWHLTRRRVRARNRLVVASADLPFAYAAWIRTKELNVNAADQCKQLIGAWSWRPRFAVFLHSDRPYSKRQLASSKSSIESSVYPAWKVIGPGKEPIYAPSLEDEVDYLVPLRVGDKLSATALFRFAEAAQADRSAVILYGDEDRIDQVGRRSRPWFKPRWNEEMFLALDYISNAMAIKAELVREITPATDRSDVSALALAAVAAANNSIVHIPHVLCHVARSSAPAPDRIEAVQRYLMPLGATCTQGPFHTVKVEWPLPSALPLVSIIIPTRDKINLLRPCVESVLSRTNYDNFELVVIDNGSVERSTSEYFDELVKGGRARVVSYPGAYSFSAINNFGVRHAQGKYLCLLNNDTEVVEPGWLSDMMRYAVRPEVGAVGAKLLYEDGTIQHAGVVVGIGEAAGHAHRFLANDEPGYFLMPHVTQFVSAVTAACLVVEKSKFEAVGGLDEQELPIAFNDVDLCLKIEAAGWRNVYVPHAVLLHHESKSRGKDTWPENIHRYRRELDSLQRRWGTKTYRDPLHNPNLDRSCETFVLRL